MVVDAGHFNAVSANKWPIRTDSAKMLLTCPLPPRNHCYTTLPSARTHDDSVSRESLLRFRRQQQSLTLHFDLDFASPLHPQARLHLSEKQRIIGVTASTYTACSLHKHAHVASGPSWVQGAAGSSMQQKFFAPQNQQKMFQSASSTIFRSQRSFDVVQTSSAGGSGGARQNRLGSAASFMTTSYPSVRCFLCSYCSRMLSIPTFSAALQVLK